MKILFEIVADQSQAAIQLAKLRGDIRTFRNELKKDGVGADRIKELNGEILKTQQQVIKLTDVQKNLNREFKAAGLPKDSLAGLRIEYAKLTDQVTKLDRATRESDFGKNLIKKTAGVKSQIDGIEQSLGRFTGNVGNYKSALLSIGDVITGGLATGGIVLGVQKIVEVMALGASQAIKYEQALDDLSALTGATGAQLEGLKAVENGLREVDLNGVKIVNTGPNILNALKLVGGAQPELLKSAESLGDVTEQAIVLSKASGDELEPSVKALTTVLGQFDLEAQESKRVINELAAGAKEGAAEIPQITDSLREFGTIAKISNVSTSESIALIEVLAERQLKGAEAGTQLRNVFSKLASADILPKPAQEQFKKLNIDVNVLKDSTLPLEDRLRELGKAQGDLSALTKIFGLENLQAATIITSGIDSYAKLNVAIQGTNEAYKQAEIRADNYATKLDNLQNGALNSLEKKFTGVTSSGGQFLDFLGFLINDLDVIGKTIDALLLPLTLVEESFKGVVGFLGLEQGAFAGGPKKAPAQADFTVEDPFLKDVQNLRDFNDFAGEDQTAKLLDQAKALQESAAADDEKGKSLKKLKEEVKLVSGSLAFFEDQISKLKKELENTPVDSPLFLKLQKNIIDAEGALDDLKAKIKSSLDPEDIKTDLLPEFSGITVPVTLEIQNEEETAKRLADFAKRTAEKSAEIKAEKENEAKLKELSEKEKLDEAIKEAALNTAQAISDGIFEIQKNKADQEKEAELSKLDEETKRKLEAAQGNAVQIEKIEKDADKKRAAIEKQAGERSKAIARTQAIINIALGVLKALSSAAPPFNFILAAATAVAGAVQLATINSQKFALGGIVKRGQAQTLGGRSHGAGGTKGVFDDGTRVEMEKDELLVVINRRNAQALKRLSAINSAGGNGVSFASGDRSLGLVSRSQRAFLSAPRTFAQGGFLDLSPQLSEPGASSSSQSSVVNVVSSFSDEQMIAFARIVAAETSAQTGSAVANGIGDADRRNERLGILNQTRQQ